MGTSDYRMATTESVLRRGLERSGDELILTLDPAFQGLPDTAHGGSVLAVFHLLAGGNGRQTVRGIYRKRVPLGVPLPLTTTLADGALACNLLDASNTTLVEGHVRRPGPDGPSETRVVRTVASGGVEEATRDVASVVEDSPPVLADRGDPLPVSSTCFACGVDNPLGLRVRLMHDDAVVGGTWQPREGFRTADGALAPVALTTLLDETAFWLGALASGESGMTTELVVTLHDSVPFGSAITVGGARGRARQRADDPRYWDTEVAARDEAGRLLADARITFVAVRGSARRLAAWLLTTNPPEIVRRVFPASVR
ncbi:MAG: hypothetical protein AUH81_17805 [Candidatus Rokubacteria bacterium 13_1_40CM_4_69_5]|nr:MAG: hypothetical protein AUH81_17805 [Candidatus Rokubacteria bacterium 13_1_40CM_4_69_5]